MYRTLAIHTVDIFNVLQAQIQNLGKALFPEPDWSRCKGQALWPCIGVVICEYSETCADARVGIGGIACVLEGELSVDEVSAVRARHQQLQKDGNGLKLYNKGDGGRCHLSILVEVVMDMRGGKPKHVES